MRFLESSSTDFIFWEVFLCGQVTKENSARGVVVGEIPLLVQKVWLSQLGLLLSHSKQGLSPSLYLVLGRNAKPGSLLSIPKEKAKPK